MSFGSLFGGSGSGITREQILDFYRQIAIGFTSEQQFNITNRAFSRFSLPEEARAAAALQSVVRPLRQRDFLARLPGGALESRPFSDVLAPGGETRGGRFVTSPFNQGPVINRFPQGGIAFTGQGLSFSEPIGPLSGAVRPNFERSGIPLPAVPQQGLTIPRISQPFRKLTVGGQPISGRGITVEDTQGGGKVFRGINQIGSPDRGSLVKASGGVTIRIGPPEPGSVRPSIQERLNIARKALESVKNIPNQLISLSIRAAGDPNFQESEFQQFSNTAIGSLQKAINDASIIPGASSQSIQNIIRSTTKALNTLPTFINKAREGGTSGFFEQLPNILSSFPSNLVSSKIPDSKQFEAFNKLKSGFDPLVQLLQQGSAKSSAALTEFSTNLEGVKTSILNSVASGDFGLASRLQDPVARIIGKVNRSIQNFKPAPLDTSGISDLQSLIQGPQGPPQPVQTRGENIATVLGITNDLFLRRRLSQRGRLQSGIGDIKKRKQRIPERL